MGGGHDGQVLLKLSTGSFGQRETPSSPPCEELCEERESFIPLVRNVIISITDEMLPWADFYAFFFPLILWSDNSTASSLCIYFFHSLSCSCLHSDTVIAGSSLVIFGADWRLILQRLSPCFQICLFFLASYCSWSLSNSQSITVKSVFHHDRVSI